MCKFQAAGCRSRMPRLHEPRTQMELVDTVAIAERVALRPKASGRLMLGVSARAATRRWLRWRAAGNEPDASTVVVARGARFVYARLVAADPKAAGPAMLAAATVVTTAAWAAWTARSEAVPTNAEPEDGEPEDWEVALENDLYG